MVFFAIAWKFLLTLEQTYNEIRKTTFKGFC